MPRKYKGRGIVSETPEPWEEAFLSHYSEYGGITLSAKLAGVSVPYVRKRQEGSPAFAEKFDEAEQLLADTAEKLLVKMGRGELKSMGFLALIARLKALRPAKYNDKLQVSGAVGHLHSPVPAAEINALLRDMIADSTPETRAQIRGEVIEAGGHVVEPNATDSPDEPQKPA